MLGIPLWCGKDKRRHVSADIQVGPSSPQIEIHSPYALAGGSTPSPGKSPNYFY